MKEVAEIRQINLKKLEVKYGSQVALAEILDTSTARVNHLLTGQRNIGEKTARKFEVLLGQPSGWMDTLDSINLQQPSSPLLDKFNQLCPEQQKEVTEFINFKLSQNKENKPLTARPEDGRG
jgi:plasmid maintenance system antidote protein VapI